MIKSTQKQETFCETCCKLANTFCIHKIMANSPSLNNTKNWKLTVNGSNSPTITILAT